LPPYILIFGRVGFRLKRWVMAAIYSYLFRGCWSAR